MAAPADISVERIPIGLEKIGERLLSASGIVRVAASEHDRPMGRVEAGTAGRESWRSIHDANFKPLPFKDNAGGSGVPPGLYRNQRGQTARAGCKLLPMPRQF